MKNIPVVVVVVAQNEIILLFVDLYTGSEVWTLRRAGDIVGDGVSGFFLLELLVQRILLLVILLLSSVVLLWRIIVVSMLSSILFAPLALIHWLHAMHRVHLLLLRVRILLVRSFLHQTYGLIVVKSLLFLVIWSILVLRGLIVVLVVILFLYNSFRPIVSFLVTPSKREMSGSSRCLYNLFICFTVKVCVVSYVFIEHRIRN